MLDLDSVTECPGKTKAARVGDFLLHTPLDPVVNELVSVQGIESSKVSDHTRGTEYISSQALEDFAQLLGLLLPASLLATEQLNKLLSLVQTGDTVGNLCLEARFLILRSLKRALELGDLLLD